MSNNDQKEKELREKIGQFLDGIIADEENSEHNVAFYKEAYTNEILEIIRTAVAQERKELVEAIKNEGNPFLDDVADKQYRIGWEYAKKDFLTLINHRSLKQ